MLPHFSAAAMSLLYNRSVLSCLVILEVSKYFTRIWVLPVLYRLNNNIGKSYYVDDKRYSTDDVFRVETEKFMSEDVDENTTFGEEYERAARFVLKYKKAILHIYDSKKRDVLQNYLETLAFSFISRFVKKEADGYGLPDEDIDYITGFYTHAIVGNTLGWIKRKLPSGQEKFIARTAGTFNATVKDMIRQCLEERQKHSN